MGQVLHRGLRPRMALKEVGMLGVLLLFGPAPVHAQPAASKKPSTQDYIRHIDQQMTEAERLDPSTGRVFRVFRWWVALAVIATIVVAAAVVLKVAGRLLIRTSATNDSEQLALSDPWIRAERARQQAAGCSAPADAPPPA